MRYCRGKASQANHGQYKHKDVGHLPALHGNTLEKERGVAVVACGDPAGVRAEKAPNTFRYLQIAVRKVEGLKKTLIFS